MAKKKEQNALDFVYGQKVPFERKEDGLVCVKIQHTGIFDKIAQKFFHRPEESAIDLDRLGSFVWLQLDGKRTVYEVAEVVEEQFGEDCHPLYERLLQFLSIMEQNGMIKKLPEPEAGE